MALAIKADYMSDDITAYLDVIDQISQREEQASLGICQLLVGFAKWRLAIIPFLYIAK